MNKVRNFYSGNTFILLMVGVVLLGAISTGIAISSGRIKTVALMFLPFGILVIASLSRRLKFWLLALSIPLSLVQIPSLPIPYGFSICEIILVFLTADELLFIWSNHDVNNKPLELGMFIPLGFFTFAGLVTSLRNGGIYMWHTYTLMPLLWFFLAYRKVHDREEAWLFVRLSLLTIVSFVAIVVWANVTGHFESLNPGSLLYQWRLGEEQLIILGPIRLSVWGIRLGSLVALGFPAGILLWLENKGKSWWGTSALLMLASFAFVLIFSAARGATVASILGTFLVILASGRFHSRKLFGLVAILLVAVTLGGETILKLFPEQNIQRLLTLLQGVQGNSNLRIRINALELAWKLTLQNPLGVGFGYLWNTYGIDDAIIYAYLLEATGILGSIAFLMIVVQLTYKFVLIIFKSSVGPTRDIASIGLSTLVVGLVAGISSQSIIFEPVHSFVFWAIIMATYHGIRSRAVNAT